MKIFYDCEFLEDGETIRLISTGMTREDGKSLYRIVGDSRLMVDVYHHPWLSKNVLPSLPISAEYDMTDLDGSVKPIVVWDSHHPDYRNVRSREDIAEDVKRFVLNTPDPELWAYYGAYDHVAICQLFGRMIDLPTGFPMYTRDLKQEIMRLGNPPVPEQSTGLHNALADATWNKETYEFLQALTKAPGRLREPFLRGVSGE
jgi:hypothetical protein